MHLIHKIVNIFNSLYIYACRHIPGDHACQQCHHTAIYYLSNGQPGLLIEYSSSDCPEIHPGAHMLSKIAIWIQSCASLIQAVASIVMMIFSILYVVFTKRLVEQNYNTFLVVTDVTLNEKSENCILVENHGSSLALNIKVSVEMPHNGTKPENRWVDAKGKNMLASGEKEKYCLSITNCPVLDNHKISISYRSQSRKTRTELWVNYRNTITYLGH